MTSNHTRRLIQHIRTGDVFVVSSDWSQWSSALYYGDWQGADNQPVSGLNLARFELETLEPDERDEIVEEEYRILLDEEVRIAARVLGRKGGAAGRGSSKRRDVDYSALGRKGGRPGPSLAAQAAVVWTELAAPSPAQMTLGPRLVAHMLDGESHIGLTPDSAARLVRDRAGRRTSAWITRDARIAGEP